MSAFASTFEMSSLATIISLVTYLVLGVYAIFTGILYYHWHAYSSDAKITSVTMITYFATTLPLLAVMIIIALLL